MNNSYHNRQTKSRKSLIAIIIAVAVALAAVIFVIVFAVGMGGTGTAGSKETISSDLQQIEQKYADSDGYVPEHRADEVLDEAMEYVQKQYEKGSVVYFEKGIDCIYMEMPDDTGLIFLPNIAGMKSGGSELKITSIGPCESEFHGTVPDHAELADEAAAAVDDFCVARTFFSGEDGDDDFDDGEVTIDMLKVTSNNR